MARGTLAEQQDFLKILYYGEPKSGKTTASAALAKLGRTIHIDAEAGLKGRPLVEHGIPIGNIEVHRGITVEELDALFWEVKGEIAAGDGPVGLIWDSVSESSKKLLELTAAKGYAKAQALNKPREQYSTFVEDYGSNTAEMRHLTRQFRDLECHVAFVALERRDVDESDGTVKYGPDLTPRLAGDLLGYVDVICHTYTVETAGEPEYWGQFRNVGKYVGGDRFHALPPALINPSFDRVLAYISGDLDLDTDPDMQVEHHDEPVETPGAPGVESTPPGTEAPQGPPSERRVRTPAKKAATVAKATPKLAVPR